MTSNVVWSSGELERAWVLCCRGFRSSRVEGHATQAADILRKALKGAFRGVRLAEEHREDAIGEILTNRILSSLERATNRLVKAHAAGKPLEEQLGKAGCRGLLVDEAEALLGRALSLGERDALEEGRLDTPERVRAVLKAAARNWARDLQRKQEGVTFVSFEEIGNNRKIAVSPRDGEVEGEPDGIPDRGEAVGAGQTTEELRNGEEEVLSILQRFVQESPRTEERKKEDLAHLTLLREWKQGGQTVASVAENRGVQPETLERACRRARDRFDDWALVRPDPQEARELLNFSLGNFHIRPPSEAWWEKVCQQLSVDLAAMRLLVQENDMSENRAHPRVVPLPGAGPAAGQAFSQTPVRTLRPSELPDYVLEVGPPDLLRHEPSGKTFVVGPEPVELDDGRWVSVREGQMVIEPAPGPVGELPPFPMGDAAAVLPAVVRARMEDVNALALPEVAAGLLLRFGVSFPLTFPEVSSDLPCARRAVDRWIGGLSSGERQRILDRGAIRAMLLAEGVQSLAGELAAGNDQEVSDLTELALARDDLASINVVVERLLEADREAPLSSPLDPVLAGVDQALSALYRDVGERLLHWSHPYLLAANGLMGGWWANSPARWRTRTDLRATGPIGELDPPAGLAERDLELEMEELWEE